MSRRYIRITAVWPASSPTSSGLPIPVGSMAGAVMHISGGFTNAHIGLQFSAFGQWQPLMDWQAGFTGVSIPSASGNASIQCPPAWFYANGDDHTVVLFSHNGTGAAVNQAAARTIVLDFKG